MLGIAKSSMASTMRRRESSPFFSIRQKRNCVPLSMRKRMQFGNLCHHTVAVARTKLRSANTSQLQSFAISVPVSVGRGPWMIDCIHSSATHVRMFSVLPFERQPQKQRQQEEKSSKRKAIEISKRITALAKERKWKEILQLYRERKDSFNDVCHSNLISQLRRIRSHKKDDPLFLAYLEDLSGILRLRGVMWMDARSVATIIHGIAAMGLRNNSSATQIVALIDDGKNAEWLFAKGDSQTIANCVWACGALGMQAPNMFRLLDQKAERLFEKIGRAHV